MPGQTDKHRGARYCASRNAHFFQALVSAADLDGPSQGLTAIDRDKGQSAAASRPSPHDADKVRCDPKKDNLTGSILGVSWTMPSSDILCNSNVVLNPLGSENRWPQHCILHALALCQRSRVSIPFALSWQDSRMYTARYQL